MTWVMGLDGGGTKTALVYASLAGEVRGPFIGPGINPFDQPDWAALLGQLLQDHPAPGPLAHATLGLPGYGEAEAVSRAQEVVVAGLLNGPHTVMNDVQAAFHGAIPGGVGVLLLAGTGSMAWASDGHLTRRAGGWGDLIGDEGSAYWLGREALGMVSRVLDWRERDRTFATQFLQSALQLDVQQDDLQAQLLGWVYAQPHPRSAIAALARFVLPLAEAGQPTAHALAEAAAMHLARHVQACREQLSAPHLPWSYAGGLLQNPFLRDLIAQELKQPAQPPVLPPLGGAVWHAAQQAGQPSEPSSDWVQKVLQALNPPVTA